MAAIDSDGTKTQSSVHHNLILSVTSSGEIIQFNKECERFTGYPRTMVIHKKFSETLLLPNYLGQWKSHLQKIQETLEVDEFTLPLKTKNGVTHQITWNGFCIKDEQGMLADICLIGTTQPSPMTSSEPKRPSPPMQPMVQNTQTDVAPDTAYPPSQPMTVHQGHNEDLPLEPPAQSRQASELTEEYRATFTHVVEKIIETTSNQLNAMSEMMKDLIKKYDSLTTRLAECETNQKDQGKQLGFLGDEYHKLKDFKDEPHIIKDSVPTALPETEKKSGFFSDPFGYRRQHQELDKKMRELEQRKKELEVEEEQVLNEKKVFNARIEEFSLWREKLEQLEAEIEKRRQELLDQDQLFIMEPSPATQDEHPVPMEKVESVASEMLVDDQLLSNIPQSAVIIQRGILKQINPSFAELIGYSMQEIMDRNFFDFIAVEGLADIERYYLHRLKGESITTYRTVLSTKENQKILVEVTVKPTLFNGEKAEIAVITGLDETKREEKESGG